ncbi:Peptidyl-prolyl cis-trans isomerase CWC27 like protein [Eufriesea mexicana]|uniref:Peptidyl-prolyl cis-trans isomerase CWC27 like protein n=1 Tax=Eufriesea mexicana TaxID=516756 RepID=A0A310S6Z5_9HYME|nr:Peptidyl-prolyl cis-trans isomerase CWC27 like protein [Eufriesea mexicana]
MTLFHSIIRGFTTQSEDPTIIGEGVKIYGEPFKNKHAIFGKVTGESICSMLKLKEALVDENDKLLYPTRFITTIILNNPFSDIISRIIVQKSEDVKDSSKSKIAGVKNFNLLSFGEKAEAVEEESAILNKKSNGNSKSGHDHLSDLKLSS